MTLSDGETVRFEVKGLIGNRIVEADIRPDGVVEELEIWYEFSGTNFDVEIRSDGKAVWIEPA